MTYPWLPLSTVEASVPYAKARGVSRVAMGSRGFIYMYRAVGGSSDKMAHVLAPGSSSQSWPEKREGFLAQHAPKLAPDALWEARGPHKGWPTRRHLALVVWAYSPDPDGIDVWLMRMEEREQVLAEVAASHEADAEEEDMDEDCACEVAEDVAVEALVKANPKAVSIEEVSEEELVPERALVDLYDACTEYRDTESCAVALIKIEGAAVELGSGAFLAFNKLPAGGIQPVLGYDLPEGEAYFHPLDPETKVYVLDGAVVLSHKNLRLTNRGLGEPPRQKGEQGDGEGPDNEVLALGPGAESYPNGAPWMLNIFIVDEEHPDDDLADTGFFASQEDAIDYLREALDDAYSKAVEQADHDANDKPLRRLLSKEAELETKGEAHFVGLVRAELRDLSDAE